jgi:hypothetical protein
MEKQILSSRTNVRDLHKTGWEDSSHTLGMTVIKLRVLRASVVKLYFLNNDDIASLCACFFTISAS